MIDIDIKFVYDLENNQISLQMKQENKYKIKYIMCNPLLVYKILYVKSRALYIESYNINTHWLVRMGQISEKLSIWQS